MSTKYRFDHRPVEKGKRKFIIVVAGLVFVITLIISLIALDIKESASKSVTGSTSTIQQLIEQGVQRRTINEPQFSFELPVDWKEIGRKNDRNENSISWQAFKKNEENRFLTLYIDNIPKTKPVNRLIPVSAQGPSLSVGDISDNCPNFTGGGTLNVQAATLLKPAPAKWQQIDFICNLPSVLQNDVGTGSTDGINMVKVKGPTKGEHTYFFVFTDHNIQPNYNIFSDALRSFKAK